jgi:glycosyltransferase involved in cell wall biosynthesis
MKVSGFTFVRNGVKLDYPFIESIRSLLPLVDELIVNVPESEDDTLARVRAIGDRKLSVFESDWDETLREGGRILSLQTNRALERCSGDLAFYLQADEVLHEGDYPAVRAAMRLYAGRPDIDGLTFRFVHFEGGFNSVNPFRYRKQVRIVRRDGSVRSAGDACGFERTDGRKLRTRDIRARVFHYGWARPPERMLEKNRELERFYHQDDYIERKYGGKRRHDYGDLAVCLPFRGSHPKVMSGRIAAAGWQLEVRSRLPLALRPRAWRVLLKKWGIWK